jgi:hypothetical protein
MAQGGAVTVKDILPGPSKKLKTRPFRKGTKGDKTILGAGENMNITGDGLEGLHDPEDQGFPPQEKEGFFRKTA